MKCHKFSNAKNLTFVLRGNIQKYLNQINEFHCLHFYFPWDVKNIQSYKRGQENLKFRTVEQTLSYS